MITYRIKNTLEYWKDASINMLINPNNDLDEIGNIVSELGVEASKLQPSIVDFEYANSFRKSLKTISTVWIN